MDLEQESKVRSLKLRVEESSEIIEKIVDQIVGKYNRELDQFISRMRTLLNRGDISDTELESAVIKIPIFYYFAVGGLESLGIEEDTAKAKKIEVFNQAYQEIEGTIQDKTKHAELATFPEYVIEIAYSRSYKKLKAQLAAAEHIFSGAKKVLSKRMIEYEVSSRDSGGVNRGRRYED